MILIKQVRIKLPPGMMPTYPLHQSLVTELYQMYWFENAWVTTLGQIGRSSCLADLGSVLKKERAYSQEHINRLGKIFISIQEQPESITCGALAGLISDLKSACDSSESKGEILFILGVIKAAHYQVGAYSGMLLLAQSMQYKEAEELIKDTLSEEKQTITDLTTLLNRHSY